MLIGERRERACHFVGAADFHRHKFATSVFGGRPRSVEDQNGTRIRMHSSADAGKVRQGHRQQRNLLGCGILERACEPGDVAARMRQTGDKSAAHWIYCACHDDGNGLGRTPRCRHRRPCPQYNDIDVLAYKLGSKVGKKLEPPFCEAPFHAEVFSLHQSDLPHASQKAAIDAGCQNSRPRSAGKKPHAPDFWPLLRVRRNRPRCRRAA